MRKIRFRQWDKKNKRFDYFGFAVDVDGIVFTSPVSLNREKYPVSQYTGLKDLKGVEIYEGDVVYICGCGKTLIEFPFLDLYEAGFEDDIGEIVGNIYENPELLGASDEDTTRIT